MERKIKDIKNPTDYRNYMAETNKRLIIAIVLMSIALVINIISLIIIFLSKI